MQELCHAVDVHVRIGELFLHQSIQFGHECLVLSRQGIFFECIGLSVFLQCLACLVACAEQSLDESLQIVRVERLGDVSHGTCIESFYLILNGVLGSHEDDWQVAELVIGLDLLA